MKMNKKGFTLVELLAVIVILAVIALIAVPQVLKILNQARRSAAEDSAYGVMESATSFIATYMLDHQGDWDSSMEFECHENNNKKECCTKENGNFTTTCLEIKGTAPKSGIITLHSNQSVSIAKELNINSFYCTADDTGKVTCAENKACSD